jgi:hypothetical protein
VLLRKQIRPRPLSELVPDVDPAWHTTIHRCLEREPGDRFQRAIDVIDALRGKSPPRRPPKGRR